MAIVHRRRQVNEFGHRRIATGTRDVVRKTGASVGSVQRQLALLVELGLVERSESANRVEYRASRASPIFAELRGLAEKTYGVEASVRAALEPFGPKVDFAARYGSVAAGTDDARSDVDVLVVGRVAFSDSSRRCIPWPSGRSGR